MNIGFIGLGHMGGAMARNLLKAGHHVILHNRTPSKAEALASEGARVAKSVGETCRNEAVVTMLADDEAVADAAFGEGKLIAELPRNAVHVSMSTISVALSDRLTEAHHAAGQAFVAAPVFGRPEAAAAAKLFIIAAGAEDAIGRAQPLFDAMGQRTFAASADASKTPIGRLEIDGYELCGASDAETTKRVHPLRPDTA
jgi:3-hydroxyisobutyrate dehydrogenase-like beta-hydroxyacid dehydrogenase